MVPVHQQYISGAAKQRFSCRQKLSYNVVRKLSYEVTALSLLSESARGIQGPEPKETVTLWQCKLGVRHTVYRNDGATRPANRGESRHDRSRVPGLRGRAPGQGHRACADQLRSQIAPVRPGPGARLVERPTAAAGTPDLEEVVRCRRCRRSSQSRPCTPEAAGGGPQTSGHRAWSSGPVPETWTL